MADIMSAEKIPVWFITGCSTGFGLELAQRVLSRGWRAVITARDVQQVTALALDVTNDAAITDAVKARRSTNLALLMSW